MRRPHGALLFMLVALLAALPVLGNTTLELVVFDLLFSATVALGLWAAADRPRQLYIGIALGVLALPAQWISYFTESTPLLMLRIGLTISFLGFTALVAAGAALRERQVGFDTIAGGISIYLLMVVIWALAYGAVGIAMGTRFLLTAESPVPRETLERYFKASVTDIRVTTQVDGMPHRVVMNELVRRLESSNSLTLLVRALRSGLAYRQLTGASVGELLSAALSMQRTDRLTRSQTLMAANAPVLIRKAMVEGRPAEGVLPSGQVAGLIDDLPPCAELISRIVADAEERITALAGHVR